MAGAQNEDRNVTDRADDWVPVTVRLPTHSRQVCIAAKDGRVYAARLSVVPHRESLWMVDDEESIELDYVTHWRDLPEPPKP